MGDFDKVFFIVLFLPYEDEGIGAGVLFWKRIAIGIEAFEIIDGLNVILGDVTHHTSACFFGVETNDFEGIAFVIFEYGSNDGHFELGGIDSLEILITCEVDKEFAFLKLIIKGLGYFVLPKSIEIGGAAYGELDAHFEAVREDKI